MNSATRGARCCASAPHGVPRRAARARRRARTIRDPAGDRRSQGWPFSVPPVERNTKKATRKAISECLWSSRESIDGLPEPDNRRLRLKQGNRLKGDVALSAEL